MMEVVYFTDKMEFYQHYNIVANEIQRDDVIQVANSLNIKITETTIDWVLLNFDGYSNDDPTSNWSEVVENMLYQKK